MPENRKAKTFIAKFLKTAGTGTIIFFAVKGLISGSIIVASIWGLKSCAG